MGAALTRWVLGEEVGGSRESGTPVGLDLLPEDLLPRGQHKLQLLQNSWLAQQSQRLATQVTAVAQTTQKSQSKYLPPPSPPPRSSTPGSGSNPSCDPQVNRNLRWMLSPRALADQYTNSSAMAKLSDKMQTHSYHVMYHKFLAPLMRRRCGGGTVRMLEIGLGCGSYQASRFNHGAGAGGSAMGWLSLFPPDLIRFDFHIMEYDRGCATRWAAKHPEAAVQMHIGDQGNATHLLRVFGALPSIELVTLAPHSCKMPTSSVRSLVLAAESGGVPFDIVIDDGSHRNEHQRFTLLETLTNERVARGGVYVVEDAVSACRDFRVNEPKGAEYAVKSGSAFRRTGGRSTCSSPDRLQGTIFDLVIEHQRQLLQRSLALPHVRHIGMFEEAVAYSLS
jgi:hypothetical protein